MVPCFPLLGLTPSGLFMGLSSTLIYTLELFPLLGLTPSGLFMGLSSTLIYTSELILCSFICVLSATRHNIHMYPYFLFTAIHHLKSSPNFSVRPCSSVGKSDGRSNPEVVGSIPTKVKRFFLRLVVFPVPLD